MANVEERPRNPLMHNERSTSTLQCCDLTVFKNWRWKNTYFYPLSICPSIHLSMHLLICLSIHPSIHMSVDRSCTLACLPRGKRVRNYGCLQVRTNPPLVKEKSRNEFELPVSATSCAKPWGERKTMAQSLGVSGAGMFPDLLQGQVWTGFQSQVIGSACTCPPPSPAPEGPPAFLHQPRWGKGSDFYWLTSNDLWPWGKGTWINDTSSSSFS